MKTVLHTIQIDKDRELLISECEDSSYLIGQQVTLYSADKQEYKLHIKGAIPIRRKEAVPEIAKALAELIDEG